MSTRRLLAAATGPEDRRLELPHTLVANETERESVLSMDREGKIDDAEAERELDAIAREAGQLRELLESMRA